MLLNIDAGERDDEPRALYEMAHSLNIACGGHAGDEASMARVLEACRRYGVRAGAHPSYPERDSFGRRTMPIATRDLARSVEGQCRALARVAAELDVQIRHIKFHGALYHDANRDPERMDACAQAAESALTELTRRCELIWVGPPKGEIRGWASRMGRAFEREGFADRGYRADGSLIPRGEPGAMLVRVDAALAQVAALAEQCETVCVHGDTPHALEFARAIRVYLDSSMNRGAAQNRRASRDAAASVSASLDTVDASEDRR